MIVDDINLTQLTHRCYTGYSPGIPSIERSTSHDLKSKGIVSEEVVLSGRVSSIRTDDDWKRSVK
jgi:hypothetical protein